VKIALPDLDVLSVDAVAKKISFQKQAARLLSLVHFEAVHARAETLVDNHAGSFDWVVSRAFSDLSSFVTLAEPLLKRDGRIVAMKGRNAAQEVSASEGALAELGTRVEYSLDFLLPGSLDARSLIVIARIKDLPCGEQH
jgi:16S rRNA (guanine527-N7)-methyltransferase